MISQSGILVPANPAGTAMLSYNFRRLSLAGLIALALGWSHAMAAEPTVKQTGKASYYSDKYHGRKTASGKRFDQRKVSAASPTLPLGTRAKVTNQKTGKTVEVEVTDRVEKGRTVDLSKEAADRVGLNRREGTAPVVVEANPSDQPTSELKGAVTAKAAGGRSRN